MARELESEPEEDESLMMFGLLKKFEVGSWNRFVLER